MCDTDFPVTGNSWCRFCINEAAKEFGDPKTNPYLTLEARAKTRLGNLIGFRVFNKSTKQVVVEHINALTKDEAIERAFEILKKS